MKTGPSTKSQEYQARYYLKNKGRIADRDRAKRMKAREHKLCVVCQKPCLDIRFKKHCSSECVEASRTKYYREWKAANTANGWFYKYKQSLGGCVRCGYNKCLAALDFNHIDPKTKQRSPSGVKNMSEEQGMKELLKCELLCANCHREHTHQNYYGSSTAVYENGKIKENGEVYE